MASYIDINGEKFYYEEVELFHGRKTINKEIAKENLIIFNSVISNSKIIYGLFFGTLLGAIREKNFIDHDEDTDIFVLYEHKNIFIELLPILKNFGLELVRYSGNYLSLLRKNEYIDIYFFEEKFVFGIKKIRTLNGSYNISAKYINNPIPYNFLDMKILIPNNPEKVLKILYGKDWKKPKRDNFAQPNSIFGYIPFLRKFAFLKVFKKYIFR